MEMIYQGIGAAIVAVICLIISGALFYQELAFDARSADVMARIEALDVHTRRSYSYRSGSRQTTSRFFATFSYTLPEGNVVQARRRVPGYYDLQHSVGDVVPARVDPAKPQNIILATDEFALPGLIFGMAGVAAAALAAFLLMVAYGGLRDRAEAGSDRAV